MPALPDRPALPLAADLSGLCTRVQDHAVRSPRAWQTALYVAHAVESAKARRDVEPARERPPWGRPENRRAAMMLRLRDCVVAASELSMPAIPEPS